MSQFSWPQNAKLCGDWFICDLLTPNRPQTSLITIDKDPRKERMKPDAFPVIVHDVGPACELIKPGDKIVVERWQWAQFDIGEGLIVAREREVLICAGSQPAPGVIVCDEIDDWRQNVNIALPETVRAPKRKYVHGKIDRSGHHAFQPGWDIWFEKSEEGQYRFGKKIIWRVEMRSALAVWENQPELEVI